MKTPFDPIPSVIADIRCGRMVIVTDDADRENEGDLLMALAGFRETETSDPFTAASDKSILQSNR